MRSTVLNGAGGMVLAACLVAVVPAMAEDTPEAEALVSPNAAPNDLKDTALANNPRRSEYSGSVAANPKNPKMLVASVASCDASACRGVVYRSDDAGRTWSQPISLPGGAALAYAPNGNRLYAAYADGAFEAPRVVVSSSTDDGKTWSEPVVALGPYFSEDALFRVGISTPLREVDSTWVYVVAQRADSDGHSHQIKFTSSADRGASWSKPHTLATGSYETNHIGLGNVAGSLGSEVLVAWSDTLPNNAIKVARSRNHGISFEPPATAAPSAYTRLYTTPEIKVGLQGAAHVVYTGGRSWEDLGDITYIWSPGPPYTTWSEPITVNDDGAGRSQYSPSLATQKCGSSTVLHLVWQDARLQPMADCYNDGYLNNCYWDVFYARKIAKPGMGWSKNVRVSGKSSFTGNAVMSPDVAASQGRVITVWTDRRDKTDPYDYETDVYASGILSGVTCP